ncbi:hypothetical protein [Glutamicibacter arilaitensis]|uniref:hypothetical protein n=1 Tax=Glutamicibacter arilaitensis TaxID=256701 RepID=UPI003FD46515
MVQNKNSNRGRKRQQFPPNLVASADTSEVLDEKDTSARLIDEWSGSRSGAWASTGFDFQHTVAAWLAARLIAGDLHAHALVPEGLEDVSIESDTSRHVQVKSRSEHLGPFPVGVASRHIVDAWLRHRGRGVKSDNLTLVLERGVTCEQGLGEFDTPLDQSLDQDSALRARITTEVKKRGLDQKKLQELLEQTSVYGASWISIDRNSRSFLGKIFDKLNPAALNYLAREIRAVVADTARLNAPVKYTDRHSLNRSELIQRSERFIAQADLDALDAAIAHGICSPLSLTEELHDDHFYEGVATQPGHVAAGLVVPRADLIGEAVSGVQKTSSVILTGPSGVGKSALLWSVPQALPGVLWFRVNRLSPDDVAEILRLCRSHRVSDTNPIGLLIDSAGTGQFSGWSQLREEAAATSGLFIISTARHEDLLSLGDLSGCTTITVALDEAGAEVIFKGLRDRNATDSPHWREAFEQAEGLTLEFTHLLTRGERLSAVISNQVRRRISELRYVELELLSLSATADRWSASLPVDKAADACGVSQFELREPLARLAEEHLLIERNGTISGVHQLRSTAISKAIHDQPPPTLDHTISRLLPALDPEQIRRFIPNALREEPQLDRLIHDIALKEQNDAVKLTAYLRGLRLFDFYERAVSWTDIAERHGIPPATQPVAQLLAIRGAGLSDVFPEKITRAISDMIAAPESSRTSALVTTIGAQRLTEALTAASNIDIANELLFELQGNTVDIANECRSILSPSSPLIEAIRRAPVNQVANILATARILSPNLAQTLIETCGGESAIAAKIRTADPWITDLWIDDSGSEDIACARVLHISDAIHGDPHDRVIALGRLLLRCFPRTAHVDVKLVLPGGHDCQIGEHQFGSTNLRREFDHSEIEVSWNQERLQITNAVLGATDTDRLAAALPLLDTTAQLLKVVGNVFAAGNPRDIDTNQLADDINALDEEAKQIRPRFNGRRRAIDIEEGHAPASLAPDPLSNLITDLTNNVFPRLSNLNNLVALAAYLSDHVIDQSLHRAQAEPWHLLGYETFPDSLKTIETDLHRFLVILSVLAEDSTANVAIGRAARAGRREIALGRAAEAARSLIKRRLRARKTELEPVGRDIGWRFIVSMPKYERYQVTAERLIALNVSSLIDWSTSIEEICIALQRAALPGEKFVLVPIRNGKPVESLTLSLITSILPSGTLGPWAAELAQPHETPLTEALDNAVASMQIASGVLALHKPKRTYSAAAQVRDEAKQNFTQSRRIVEQAPTDAITNQVVQFLDVLEEKLDDEESGESVGGDLASQLLLLEMQGQETEMTIAMARLRLTALEWDIYRGSGSIA